MEPQQAPRRIGMSLECRYRYDPRQPLWIAPLSYAPSPLLINLTINVTASPAQAADPFPRRRFGDKFVWYSGAPGWFLSRPVARAFAAAWPGFT